MKENFEDGGLFLLTNPGYFLPTNAKKSRQQGSEAASHVTPANKGRKNELMHACMFLVLSPLPVPTVQGPTHPGNGAAPTQAGSSDISQPRLKKVGEACSQPT